MPLESDAEVDEIRAVQDETGASVKPANQTEQAKTNDRLGNHPGLQTASYSTSSTAAEQLPANSVPEGVEVLVLYDTGNAGTVWVGDANAQPVPLASKSDVFTTRVEDTSAIYVRTPSSGDSVNLIWEA